MSEEEVKAEDKVKLEVELKDKVKLEVELKDKVKLEVEVVIEIITTWIDHFVENPFVESQIVDQKYGAGVDHFIESLRSENKWLIISSKVTTYCASACFLWCITYGCQCLWGVG